MGSKKSLASTVVKIKKEAPDEEIKEYAETAMNELLGWYGYGKMEPQTLHPRGDDSSSDAESGRSPRASPPPSPPPVNVPAGCLACAWCRKVGPAAQFALKTSSPQGHKAFCSEVCFTQCRRASFKRNKTCDWCRHVRHTVNYVDFQDGDHQLQFCSDKCLNQYKMNIFCKETQAHLQLHPHLKESSTTSGPAGSVGTPASTLITPDLWMRDCRSETPDSDKSRSPERIPSPIIEITTSTPPKVSPTTSPSPVDDLKPTNLTISIKTVTASAGISPKSPKKENSHTKPRRFGRNKRTKIIAPIVTPQVEMNTNSSSPRSTNSGSPPRSQPPPFMPPMPPYHLPHNPIIPPDHPLHRPPFLNPGFFPPPHILAELASRLPMPQRPQVRKPHPNNNLPPLLPLHQNIRFSPPMGFSTPPQPPPPVLPSLLPPPTLMVPYPFPVPIPIPILIPIPIPPNFKLKEEGKCDENPNIFDTQNIKVETDSPSTSPNVNGSLTQPLRKRKRPETDEELIRKQKSVPA